MKKPLIILAIVLVAAGLWTGHYYWQNLRGAGPALSSPPADIAQLLNKAKGAAKSDPAAGPLKLPPGFAIHIFARQVPGARVLVRDPAGNLLVSLTRQGRVVALPDKNRDGVADKVVTVLSGLDNPHGLAFGPEKPPRLYVAETDQVASYAYDPQRFRASHKQKLVDLPPGGRHFTRTLLFLPPPQEYRLLISVGSDCNVCVEKDWRYAKILETDIRHPDLKTYASGLRNAVFMTLQPLTRQVWATEMGRDYLGDNLPPDEIDIIKPGADYGWPWCYGKQVHDNRFDPRGSHRAFCRQTVPAYIDIPAHSAPLGLAFFPKEWPPEFRYNLLVAYHGSWNRTVPTGYKVVLIKLDPKGRFLGIQNFITGWLTPRGALGRPVDILVQPHGLIYISDDKAGVIYRVVYRKR